MYTTDQIEIRIGLPENRVKEAAELFYDAFQQKLYPILGNKEQGIVFLQKYIDSKNALVALCGNQVIGIAGLQHEGHNFFSPSISNLAHEFGWLRGFLKIIRMRICHSQNCDGVLYLKAIMVSTSMRDRGVGTQLLTGVTDFAWAHGFNSVRLDVVDTNPDARRFYERHGFVATKIRNCPFPFLSICRPMGFSSAITMIKMIP
jgi:ribosomal protein S18 acetylase RimI-like enzyme